MRQHISSHGVASGRAVALDQVTRQFGILEDQPAGDTFGLLARAVELRLLQLSETRVG